MTMKVLFALAIAWTALATPEIAVAQASGSEAKAAKEKMVCRTYKVTGSLTRRTRICRTEAEWREVDLATGKGVSDLQGSAGGPPKCMSPVDLACNPGAAGF